MFSLCGPPFKCHQVAFWLTSNYIAAQRTHSYVAQGLCSTDCSRSRLKEIFSKPRHRYWLIIARTSDELEAGAVTPCNVGAKHDLTCWLFVLASSILTVKTNMFHSIVDGFYAGASINTSSGAMMYNLHLLTVWLKSQKWCCGRMKDDFFKLVA